MTNSLTLSNGSQLSNGHNEQRASFQRRKNYDPMKAVEIDKQKRLLKQQQSSPLKNSFTSSQNSNRNSMISTENESYRSNHQEEDSMSDSSQANFSLQALKQVNASNKQVNYFVIYFFIIY